MKKLSLYIHVPFCISKCVYCDFYSLSCGKNSKKTEKAAYLNAVLHNIEKWKFYGENRCIDTVFIGGGTPTTLDTYMLSELITAVKNSFNVSPNVEFTIEANPKTFDEEKLTALRRLGVNRLSIGVQSGIDTELKLLSRIHTSKEAKESFELARKCGFDNISIDLMYGIPSQTIESFKETLEFAVSLCPEHISVYGLQIEEGTQLWKKREKYVFPSEDEEAEMNLCLMKTLKNSGYARYEISNYSLPGKECRHNLGYWAQAEYIGFGPGAYSYFDGIRFYLPSDLNLYCGCDDLDKIVQIDEVQTKEDTDKEFIMLSLRLTRGADIKLLGERGIDTADLLNRCEKFIKNGYMQAVNGQLSFTDKGFNISNYILSEILF